MTLLISMVTRNGIFMIADSLEVGDNGNHFFTIGNIEKLSRIKGFNVVLSFWGTIEISTKNFSLINELNKFESTLTNNENVDTISEKIKDYFENLNILDETDSLGFHICGYVNGKPQIHHVHHIPNFYHNKFINEDSTHEYGGQPRELDYPILFNGDNKIPNLIINLIKITGTSVNYKEFSNEQSKKFLIFLMDTAIRLQIFSSDSLQYGELLSYPLLFSELTENNVYIERISDIYRH